MNEQMKKGMNKGMNTGINKRMKAGTNEGRNKGRNEGRNECMGEGMNGQMNEVSKQTSLHHLLEVKLGKDSAALKVEFLVEFISGHFSHRSTQVGTEILTLTVLHVI
jgi:hypothetical protein